MKHAAKTHLARTMLTASERTKAGRPAGLFLSKGWEDRKKAIAARVAKRQGAAHERAVLRREQASLEGKTGVIAGWRRRRNERRQAQLLKRSERNRRWQAKRNPQPATV